MSFEDDLKDDLPVFLDPKEFGIEAIYNGDKIINVVFDDGFQEISPGTVAVETTAPVATARSVDVKNWRHGDTLKIGDVAYFVRGIQQDGESAKADHGLTAIILSKD